MFSIYIYFEACKIVGSTILTCEELRYMSLISYVKLTIHTELWPKWKYSSEPRKQKDTTSSDDLFYFNIAILGLVTSFEVGQYPIPASNAWDASWMSYNSSQF